MSKKEEDCKKTICFGCGNIFKLDDLIKTENGFYCSECYKKLKCPLYDMCKVNNKSFCKNINELLPYVICIPMQEIYNQLKDHFEKTGNKND